MKYKFTSVIILLYIAFIFQSCVSVSNEKSVQDIWELQRLNTYWNKYNITYFTVSGKICFDNEKGLEVITPDGFLVGSLDDAVCSEYIQMHPEIRYQYETSDLCNFTFTKREDGFFYLTEIDNLDIEKLTTILNKVQNEDCIFFRGNFYKKIDSYIQNEVTGFYYNSKPFYFNNPYGFSKNCYYHYIDHYAQVIQWINEKSCLINFAPPAYATNDAYAYVEFDNSISKTPAFNGWYVLYHYEGVYSYVTTWGNTNVLPKFRLIFSEEEIQKNTDKLNDNKVVDDIEYISNSSKFLIENNPYGLNKDTIYKDARYAQPQVLQWLNDGCLLDYNNPHVSGIYWDCIVYVVLTENEMPMLFSQDYEHYYKYIGVYEYITTTGAKNTVPKFKSYFTKKD